MSCEEHSHHHGHHHHGRHPHGCDGEGHGENCTCDCGCHGGGKGSRFERRYQTRAEQIADLEAYLADLKTEVQAVEERLAELRK